jgi:photosystem II stability/assembly factor-like uncharacterized protein
VAGTRNALLFRSRDAGNSWAPIPFPAQLRSTLNAFAIDPQTPGVYLAGLSGDSPSSTGILRSADFGATWRQVPELRNEQVRAIAFKRASSRVIAAGTDTGVFASYDGGATWGRISPSDHPQLRPVVAVAFDPNDPMIVYAGTPHLPWRTSDGGANWISIHNGMFDDSDVFSIQVDRNRPSRVFAGACSGIYRSLNSAANWTRLSEPKNASYRTYAIAQDLQYENVWFAGTTHGLVRSSDGGSTWKKIGPFATRSIAFDPGRLGRILIATDQSGILRSDDGGRSWFPVNNGFCNRRIDALWTDEGRLYAALLPEAGQVETLQLSDDLSKWTRSDAIAPEPVARDAPNSRPVAFTPHGMLMATFSGLKSSSDQGRSWHAVRGPLESDTIQAICRHPRKSAVLFAAKFGVIYQSTDGGRSWASMSSQPGPLSSITQLTILPGTPDRLLVLTAQQGVWEMPL